MSAYDIHWTTHQKPDQIAYWIAQKWEIAVVSTSCYCILYWKGWRKVEFYLPTENKYEYLSDNFIADTAFLDLFRLVVEPTPLKKYARQNGFIIHQVLGENKKSLKPQLQSVFGA